MRAIPSAHLLALLLFPLSAAGAEALDATPGAGEAVVAALHAQGSQIYECKADPAGELVWYFREPIATLVVDGKTVGRHFAGPSWELSDGSAVTAKVIARAPGATDADIPHLILEVTSQRGAGRLSGATTIRRLGTKGGAARGPCERPGAILNVPYSADYVFYKGN